MTLSIGIVGLPNVGKSTLFNAVTNSGVEAENYPFCTIEPNKGIVPIPDPRLEKLGALSNTDKIINATIEFVDIAGLVKGAANGEGLGNQFLTNIRQTSAICHVCRCFSDDNITHVHGNIDPLYDIDIINSELLLADLQQVEKMRDAQQKKAKSNKKEEVALLSLLNKLYDHLSTENPVRTIQLSETEEKLCKQYQFLTAKKVIYVANISEDELMNKLPKSVEKVKEYANNMNDQVVVISAKIEQELSQLEPDEKKEYLAELGLEQSGLDQLSKACFKLLGLQTFLTTGKKETRAWTIPSGSLAPQAAGVIHTDFEKGFIRANIINYLDFIKVENLKVAKEKGLVRQEGRDYIMQEGDIVEFLFNV
ncbi:redox-regulated ATPase YchF [Candidatus Marinamargulisbacteria bacterium SCGC AG-410-N11]|nr:redox-regulated ATPase YchF [Candidatus Marinamargulisbacteria bacterium SCGC AG-410-N11]